jgi:hypothetical protein
MRFLLESDDRRHATFTFDAAGMAYGKIEHAEEGVTTGRTA